MLDLRFGLDLSSICGSVGFLLQTSMACKFYMFEEHYVEYLVKKGLLPTCFSSRGIRPVASVTNVAWNEALKGGTEHFGEATEHIGEAVKLVEESLASLDKAVTALKDAENTAGDRIQDLSKKVDRLGELVLVGVANLFVLVLVLLVLLVK